MAEGRFLSKSIAQDWELNRISLEADYLFMRCVPHLDREGRLTGHPGELKGMVVPLRDEMTIDVIDRCLAELAEAGLVLWYEVDGKPALWFKGFVGNQRNARLEREASSKLPPQNHPALQRLSSFVRPMSGHVRTKSAEVKGREGKLREEKLKRPVVQDPGPRAREVAPPAGQDGLSLGLARERAAEVFRSRFHLGQDAVVVGRYRETLDDAMRYWDQAVKRGRDPMELNAELELVRVVENFAHDEPITAAVYFGRKRTETRELCRHERIKRQPAAPALPPVSVDPPQPEEDSWTEKQKAASRTAHALIERQRREREARASA